METPIPDHYLPGIQAALAEINNLQRIAGALASAAAAQLGIKNPCSLSADGRSLVTED
jgi:hypothetical protein